MDKLKIILASQSPRRKELLTKMGIDFDIIVSNVEEKVDKNTKIEDIPVNLAKIKAQSVFDTIKGDKMVIGCDTIVVYRNKIFGKPKNESDAKHTLKLLSGRTHKVITGLYVLVERNNKVYSYKSTTITKIKMSEMTDSIIDKYIKNGEPMDKAGAYGIQGIAGMFVEEVIGNYDSVIGLPTNELYKIFEKENIEFNI